MCCVLCVWKGTLHLVGQSNEHALFSEFFVCVHMCRAFAGRGFGDQQKQLQGHIMALPVQNSMCFWGTNCSRLIPVYISRMSSLSCTQRLLRFKPKQPRGTVQQRIWCSFAVVILRAVVPLLSKTLGTPRKQTSAQFAD